MGTPYHIDGQFGDYRQISYRRGAVGVNPRWAIQNNHYYEATNRFFGNMNVVFKPAEWVRLKYQVGMDAYTTNNEDYQEVGYGNLLAAGGYPTPADPVFDYLAPTGGSINNYGVTRKVFNSLFTAIFEHRFSEAFGGSLMLGNEVDDNQSEYYYATGTGFQYQDGITLIM
ncbi:MAG: hypothetical protein HC831_11880 [Chloroflexia bacterium]|nr:hypothetical protein [Chloroflexia bacterium]